MEATNLLVTGGAGFIGSELVRQAVACGYSVIVVDNLLNGCEENLAGLPADRVRLVVADIRDKKQMRKLIEEADVVYHLACLCVRHSIHSPQENHNINSTGTLGLLSLARDVGLRRFVFTSSAEVYGHIRTPRVSEDHPARPTNVYGAAKLGAEGYCRAFHESYGVPSVVLRLFNTYGPRCHHEGDCGEVIPKFLLRSMSGLPMVVFGDGIQTRDFNYVSDTARAVLLAGLTDEAVGNVINVGSGYETSVNELALLIAETVNRAETIIEHDSPRPGDIARMCADGTKARELLGYEPVIPLKEGLKRLRGWYIERGMSFDDLLNEEVVHNWDLRELRRKPRSRDRMALQPSQQVTRFE